MALSTLRRYRTRPTSYVRLGNHLIDADSLTYVELRSLIAVGIAQFFALLGSSSLTVVRDDLPKEVRGGVKKALRILRTKSVPSKWID